ncbi:MAG TPA: hypothetical protein VMK84_10495 [Streptosporangiaceae bacterium]|nr:hypothetical protein [Streptosporangiaceae bacterium]
MPSFIAGERLVHRRGTPGQVEDRAAGQAAASQGGITMDASRAAEFTRRDLA